MSVTVSIDIFLKEIHERHPVIFDTRSPGEYHHAHVPGAVSFPLLNDEERKIIGTTYKLSGREAAVVKGFELAGPKFAGFVTKAKELSPQKEVMIYCWRGGLRSNIMAWILSTAGFKVTLLKDGYKSFRNWVILQFNETKNIIVIGGKTGSGKTELLNSITKLGEQVIDLEALAHHKGSAFGSLGQLPQPSTEQFENLLALQWSQADPDKILWLENESLLVGMCPIPNAVFEQMRNAPVVEVCLDFYLRKKRILAEYGHFKKESLSEKTKKIKKRLGGLRLKDALQALEEDNLNQWCDIMLEYYDKTYDHSNMKRDKAKIHELFLVNDDMKTNSKEVIDFVKNNFIDVSPFIVNKNDQE